MPPSKRRLYDHPRPERRSPFGPSPERLRDVSAISVEKHMLCLSRPLFWLKYCFKGFYQTLKTTRRILTRTGRSYDPLSRRLRILLQEAQRNISLAVTLLKNLGFAVNREKTCLIPTQVLKFLRFVIGSTAETLSLLEEKVLKVKCLCMKAISTPTMSARQLASLLAPWIPVVWQYGKHPVISDT